FFRAGRRKCRLRRRGGGKGAVRSPVLSLIASGVTPEPNVLGDLEFLDGLLIDGLQRSRHLFGGVAGGRLEVLGLLDAGLDALAQERGLELENLGEALGGDERLEMGKARLGV